MGFYETLLSKKLNKAENLNAPLYEMLLSKRLAEGGGGVYYGMIIDQSESDPSKMISYIGKNENYTPMSMNLTTGVNNYGDWADMPTIVKNKPAMIRTDGTFDYWLDENDYTKKADGTPSDVANIDYDGNAFAWFEPIWCRLEEDGDLIDVRFAYSQLDDSYFEVCPEGCGIWLPMFYGWQKGAKDHHMRSIAGTSPMGSNIGVGPANKQKEFIALNGSNYMFFGGKVLQAISLLLLMWYKTTNSNAWGLGNADNNDQAYLLNNPIVNGGQFYGTNTGNEGNKVLHSLVINTYDVEINDVYTARKDGKYIVSKDYSVNIVDGEGYEQTNITIDDSMIGGMWVKKMTVIDGYGIMPSEGVSYSAVAPTEYYCDYVLIPTADANSFAYMRRFKETSNTYKLIRTGLFFADWRGAETSNGGFFGCAMMLKQAKE